MRVTAEKKQQTMKPLTAANKLDLYLPATPEEFQSSPISRAEFDQLRTNPPGWLSQLRQDGPHPRGVVARKLNISIAGLARGGVTEALTTAEIDALLETPPEWLLRERSTHAQVRAEAARQRDKAAEPARVASPTEPVKRRK